MVRRHDKGGTVRSPVLERTLCLEPLQACIMHPTGSLRLVVELLMQSLGKEKCKHHRGVILEEGAGAWQDEPKIDCWVVGRALMIQNAHSVANPTICQEHLTLWQEPGSRPSFLQA